MVIQHTFKLSANPYALASPQKDMHRSMVRKASRAFWEQWCNEHLERGDELRVESDLRNGKFFEYGTFQYVDDAHIHVIQDNVQMGIPTCYVTDVTKVQS